MRWALNGFHRTQKRLVMQKFYNLLISILDFLLSIIKKQKKLEEKRVIERKKLEENRKYRMQFCDKYRIGNNKMPGYDFLYQRKFNNGEAGERKVGRVLSSYSKNNNDAPIMEDILLPYRGNTTQIDHVLISEYGIFVIETKEYSGWIFGNATSKKWTQMLNPKTKNQFQNPLIQNNVHINALAKNGTLNIHNFFSIVVFVGDATFKTKMPANVIYASDLHYFLKSFKQKILNKTEMEKFYTTIEEKMLDNTEENKKIHIQFLQKKHAL